MRWKFDCNGAVLGPRKFEYTCTRFKYKCKSLDIATIGQPY